ncbi:MAG: acetolactate synthase small subunit [Proteobacteria bacterium]|nr:MAG: acetolactate synthase small subunit [Pseudomonadota bacterium]
MTKNYTFTIYSNDQTGILNRISAVFSRAGLNIEALSVCESTHSGLFRHNVQVSCDAQTGFRVSQQLERQIEVIKADFYHQDEIIQQELALYKIASKSMLEQTLAEQIIHRHHARVLSMNSEFTVIEKIGKRAESQALFDDLSTVGVLEFVRSGPVSISKLMTTESLQEDMPVFKQHATCESENGQTVETSS